MEEQEEGVIGRRKRARRGKCTWERNILDENCLYPEGYFRCRFRIPKALYFRTRDDLLGAFSEGFKQK